MGLGFEEDLLEVDRREFMYKLIGALGSATVAPLADGVDAESLERIASGARRPSRVDRTTVEQLEMVTQTHRDLYRDLSSVELIGAATGHLHVTTLLLEGAQRLPLHRRLAAIAGDRRVRSLAVLRPRRTAVEMAERSATATMRAWLAGLQARALPPSAIGKRA